MNQIKLLISLLFVTCFYTTNLTAGIVNGTSWIIKPGDSLYKIARDLAPGNTKLQAKLRKQLVNQNPQVFKNGANNISVGDKLQLPDIAVKKQKPVTPVIVKKPEPVKKVVEKPVEELQAEVTETVTVDPEDIVGQVVINTGNLSAENRGSTRKLNRRSNIFRGDTLSTGGRSHTQIRLRDGALLALRPHTDIRIAEYQYNGQEDGTESSVLELIKGGFRTITGAIGHKNKQNYKVRTTVATIGIRGTHYTLVLCQQQSCSNGNNGANDGLYGGVTDGSIVIENQTGIHRFNNDQFFKITSASSVPVEQLIPPAILKTGPLKMPTKAKKDRQQVQDSVSQHTNARPRRLAVIFEPNQPTLNRLPRPPVADLTNPPVTEFQPDKAPDGSGMLIGFHHLDNTGAVTGASAPVIIAPANDNEIFLTSVTAPDGTVAGRIPFAAKEFSVNPVQRHDVVMASPTGVKAQIVPSSLGGDSLGVNWGRWNGEFTVLEDGVRMNTKENFHFIYSENITTPSQLANLGGLTGTYYFSSVAGKGTLPTDHLGNVGTSLASIGMDVDFQNAMVTNYNIDASVNGHFYSAAATNINFQDLNQGFQIQSISAGCLSGPCQGEASVLFVGDQAQGAITSYHMEEPDGSAGITGTNLLINQGVPQ